MDQVAQIIYLAGMLPAAIALVVVVRRKNSFLRPEGWFDHAMLMFLLAVVMAAWPMILALVMVTPVFWLVGRIVFGPACKED